MSSNATPDPRAVMALWWIGCMWIAVPAKPAEDET